MNLSLSEFIRLKTHIVLLFAIGILMLSGFVIDLSINVHMYIPTSLVTGVLSATLLICVFNYWLFYRFNKPKLSLLTFTHVGLVFVLSSAAVLVALLYLFNNGNPVVPRYIIEVAKYAFLLSWPIFLVNAIYGFSNPSVNDEE